MRIYALPFLGMLLLLSLGCGSKDPLAGNWTASNAELNLRGDNRFQMTLGAGTFAGTWTNNGGSLTMKVDTIDGQPKEQAFKTIEENSGGLAAIPGATDKIKELFDDQTIKVSEDKAKLTWNWSDREIVFSRAS